MGDIKTYTKEYVWGMDDVIAKTGRDTIVLFV